MRGNQEYFEKIAVILVDSVGMKASIHSLRLPNRTITLYLYSLVLAAPRRIEEGLRGPIERGAVIDPPVPQGADIG